MNLTAQNPKWGGGKGLIEQTHVRRVKSPLNYIFDISLYCMSLEQYIF